MALPKLKKWPKGLKARLARAEKKAERISLNKKIAAAIEAARRKLA